MNMMLTFRLLLAVALLPIVVPAQTFAQADGEGTISGVVIDAETGEPLPGASVFIADLGTGSATDIEGTYSLEGIPEGSWAVRVSFVGYRVVEEEVEVTAGEDAEQNFSLQPDVTGLEEVVVTGIASSRSKAASEVAVSTVNAEELTKANTYQDVSQLMAGKTPGVNVQPASGNVGGGLRFNIRGGASLNGSQPIIYVDGVRLDNSEITGFGAGGQGYSTLADLNPEDIASVEVLKGPAGAAIYGTDGANGVVLITTKRGQLNSDLNLTYKGTFGSSEMQNEYSEDQFISAADANEIFRTGDIQQHVVSLSGGSEFVSFFTSVTHRDDMGILRNNEGERTNFRANFEAYPSNKVTLRANASYAISDYFRPDNDNNIFGQLGNVLLAPGGSTYYFTDSLSVFDIEDRMRTQHFVGSVSLAYSPIDDLTFSFTGGYDGSGRRQDKTYPQNRGYAGVSNGERNVYNRISNQYNLNSNATYEYTILPKLTATSIVGAQFVSEHLQTFFGTAQSFSTELIRDVGAGSEIQSTGEGFNNVRKGGIYAQQDFAYDNTYFVTAQLRRDFATSLGENVEVAAIVYPALRGSVRLDRFDAVPSAFSLLKLRAAYGETGNLPGLLESQRLRFTATPSGFGAGATFFSVGDEALEPERVREFETGIDLEFAGRYGLEATYFTTSASNSIINFDPAPSSGFGRFAVPRNVGGIESSGVELGLSLTPFRTQSSQLDISADYTYARNEVTDLGGAPPIFSGFDLNVVKEGLAKNAFYTTKVEGARFADDGTYAGIKVAETADPDDDDRFNFGTPYPNHYGGLNVNLRLFKNLNISALAEFAAGHSIFNNTKLFAVLFGNSTEYRDLQAQLGFRSVEGIEALDPGTEAYREAANEYARMNPNYDGNFIEDADYIKLREVSVRYDFGDLLNRTGLASVRSLSLGVSARNVATWTDYSGADPEVNFGGAFDDDLGQDFLTLQNPRQIYFTLSAGI